MDPKQNPDTVIPPADRDFLRTFLPYELRLAQRRALVWGSPQFDELPNPFIGLYLVRLEMATAASYPAPEAGGTTISEHVQDLLHEVLRDSDIPVIFSEKEHLAVLRDIDPGHAFVVAQRMLGLASRSRILQEAGVRTRVGYVVYPLSPQPNFPPERWHILLELARGIASRGHSGASTSGYGILRGPRMNESSITESDLVPLIFRDPDSLVKAGLLQLQRIHLAGEV